MDNDSGSPPYKAGEYRTNDTAVDIVDALRVAQYYVGLNPSNFDSANADSNSDNQIDIVDAF